MSNLKNMVNIGLEAKSILERALVRVINNGWKYNKEVTKVEEVTAFVNKVLFYADNSYQIICGIIFSHSFAKAFWGEVDGGVVECKYHFYDGKREESSSHCISGIDFWQYHLQQMVLEENPLLYLDQFLVNQPLSERTQVVREQRFEAIQKRLFEIIVNKLGVELENITLDKSFVNDLGCDSLDVVEIVMTIESKFGISISDEDVEKIQSVGDAINYLYIIKNIKIDNGKI